MGGFRRSRPSLQGALQPPQLGGKVDHIAMALNVTHATGSTSYLCFTGISNIEWTSRLPNLIHRFKAKKDCFRLVDPGVQVFNVNAPELIVESTFTEPEVDVEALSDAERNVQLAAIDAWRDGAVADATANLTYSVAARQVVINNIHQQRLTKQLDVETGRGAARSRFQKDKEQRERRLKDHQEVEQNCMECFNTYFSPDVLQPYATDLQAHRFRKVWMSVCDRYGGRIGGAGNATATLSQLMAYVYDINYNMDSNIQYIEVLNSQLLVYGTAVSEPLMSTILCGGIQKSAAHRDIKDVVTNCHNNQFDYERVKHCLRETFTHLQNRALAASPSLRASANAAQVQHKGSGKKRRGSAATVATVATPAAEVAGVAGTTGGNGKRRRIDDSRVCTYCKKTGHTADRCWQLHPCPHCNSKEHGEWSCPHKPVGGTVAVNGGRSVGGGAPTPTSLHSMFTAHNGKN
jgi:hypothetical protein